MKIVDPEKTVIIIGADQFQIALISFFLERKFGLKTTAMTPQAVTVDILHNCELLLLDFEKTDPYCPSKAIDPSGDGFSFPMNIALYNVVRNRLVVDETYKKDICGLFFNGDTMEIFENGLKAIFRGKTWFPDTGIKSSKHTGDEVFLGDPPLTRREKEVLYYMSSGSSNYEIAEYLDISPHTVKNHITNIYKKINVSNRLQACMWAARYLAL